MSLSLQLGLVYLFSEVLRAGDPPLAHAAPDEADRSTLGVIWL